MMITDDLQLLEALKQAAAKCNYSPYALIQAGVALAEWSKYAVNQNFGPYPHTIDEAPISEEVLAEWPDWVADLVPPGSKWERLHWPDGSKTVRLIDRYSLVLAAKHFPDLAQD